MVNQASNGGCGHRKRADRRTFLRRAASTAAALAAAPLAAMIPPSRARLPGDPEKGRALFAKYGAACHGASLEGGVGPRLHPIAKLPGTKDPLDPQYLIHTITYGRPASGGYGAMPPKGGVSGLTDEDIRDLAAFIITENRSGRTTLSTVDLARSNVFWVSVGTAVLGGVAYLLTRYNMRWIRRRSSTR
jgi:mono/diheme cytochrome c family protein